MAGFLFALLAMLVAGFGARDQLLVAAISVRQTGRGVALFVALASAVLTALAAVWLARASAPLLAGNARIMFAALALAVAGLELIWTQPARLPAEPTRSLGAFALVLFAQQLTDGGRFLLFAIALASDTPLSAGLGGACGAALVIAAGWAGGAELLGLRLQPLRRGLGLALIVLAVWLAWSVRG